jgi:hypothetical protein
MAEKEVPYGSDFIKMFYEDVKKGTEIEEVILKGWKERLKKAEEGHLYFLIPMLEASVNEAKESLEKRRERIRELKLEIPNMIKDWEDYWGKPFPYPDIKAEVERWETEEEPETVEEEFEELDRV